MKSNLSTLPLGLAFMLGILLVPTFSMAAITESGQPIDGIHQPGTSLTMTPGAIVPLTQFMLVQSSGTDTLSAVGVRLNASSTISLGEISRISLWQESGAQFGFQVDQDTFIAGAASTTPMVDGSLIVLTPSSAVSIGASDTEFYVIATTSAMANITNGDGFHVSLDGNYASTTDGLGLGTAYTSSRKITLAQTAPLKISEVQLGMTGNAHDEFIEIYNTSPFDLNVQDLGLALHIFGTDGAAGYKALTYYKTVMPAYGYFLLGSATNYSHSRPLDATYITLSGNTLVSNGGFSIATSTNTANATTTKIDMIGWGATLPAGSFEGTILSDLAVGSTYERKALTGSTNTTMASGGADLYKGNGYDSDVNNDDFVTQTGPYPQNSTSPEEFPLSGGGDTGAPRVIGSFPDPNATGVPIDMSYIGFGFSEPVSTSTVISASATTTVTLTASGSSTNLCTSVTYDPAIFNGAPARCVLSANLLPSTVYTFTATSTIYDFSGNALDQDTFTAGNQGYSVSFTTGGSSDTATNITPPHVVGSSPMPGSTNIPINTSKIFVGFDQLMDETTLVYSNFSLINTTDNTAYSLSGETFSFSTSTKILTITLSSDLVANKSYTLTVSNLVKNSSGMSIPGSFLVPFETASSADATAPQILGTMPIQSGATGVLLNTIDFIFVFDDNIDASTATSGSVTLGVSGGANVPGAVTYDPMAKEGHFTANNALPANSNMVLTLVGASIKNTSGVALGTDYTLTFSTEASNSDSTAPSISFANADEFGVAITFDEPVRSSDATNLSNYALTVGGSSVTLSAMAGHAITYDAETRTARIAGTHLAPDVAFSITVSDIFDISGNQMTLSVFNGTVMSIASSGGFLGPGEMMGDFGPADSSTFTTGGMGGFMPPVNVMPFSTFKSASTTYGFEMPIAERIPANGSVVITFPSSADFGINSVATTSDSYRGGANGDINGPGPGTIGIKTISVDSSAKTITLTLDTATRSELMGGVADTHDFLRFDLLDIKNASIPKGPDSSGYLLDIKTKNASGTLLETLSPSPIYITGGSFGGAATTTIRGRILGSNGNYGLNGVTVRLDSFITGPTTYTSANNVYGGSDGEFAFTDLPVGNDYMLFTDHLVSPTATTTGYFGSTIPMPIKATSTDIHLNNITLTATSSASTFTVKVTAGASTFGASEKIDIFAGGPGQFTVQTVTPGASVLDNATIATLSLPQQNGMWNIGMGPAMPKDGMFMGPPPATTWQMPKPVDVQMSGCPSACATTIDGVTVSSYTYTISTADRTITGVLQDDSGNVMANAMIFAYSSQLGVGTHAQTSSAGTFTLNVSEGTYNVGSFFPGMGQSKETPVEVTATAVYINGSKTASTGVAGANPFILKMVRPSYTISGRFSDGNNSIPNAPVFAYRTDGPGHADAMTDSSGNYTLYVDNGSWRVGGYLPGYGPLTERSVTISGASVENINFSPSGGTTYWNVLGTVFESANSTIDSGEGVSGAIVNIKSSTGLFYETKTGSDGTYNLRVPEANGYTMELFKPGYGRISPVDENLNAVGSFNVAAATTKNIRINSRQTITINIKDSSGDMLSLPEAFIDLFDMNQNFGNHAEIRNASSTTIQIANGASTTIRAFVPSVPPNSISVSSDDAGTLVLNGVLEVDGNEVIKVVVGANLRTISGTVYHTSATSGNELKDVWVEVFDTTNGLHYGVNASSTNGTYSIKLADGTYKISAMKPGYTMAPQALTVTADATGQDFVLTSADLTISGTVTAGGSAASSAFVRAEKVGGGFVVTKTDTSGAYSLAVDSGQWRVFAASDKYLESAYSSNPITVSASVTGINITLSNAATIQDSLATSPTFTDTSSGSFNDSTVNVGVVVDAGALGQSGSSSYITAKETANFTETPGIDVIADKAKDISAYSGSSQVKNLSTGKKAEISLTYTVAELASSDIDTPAEVEKLKVGAWSEDTMQWESLNTTAVYKDTNGAPVAVATSTANIPASVTQVTFTTAEASHFSPYALLNPSDPTAPATPSGLAVASDSSSQLTITWTANTEGDLSGYYLYKDTSEGGSFALLTSVSGATSYSDTGLNADTAYYYKIAAYDTDGYESAASSAASGTTAAPGGGSVLGSVGGGGSVPTPVLVTIPGSAEEETVLEATEEAVTEEVAVEEATVAVEEAQVSPIATAVSSAFNKTLRYGTINDDVKRLQELLATDSEIYPEGLVTGYFGALTRTAVKRFQAKHDIVSSGDENSTGYGLLGPKTRAMIGEVFGGDESLVEEVVDVVDSAGEAVEEAVSDVGQVTQVQIEVLEKQIEKLQETLALLLAQLMQMLQEQVQTLQQQL